jgi:5-methylcytosine-specific restriction endonuclease McrA
MPIRPEMKDRYPKNWKEISERIKERDGNKCVFCGAENYKPNPITGSMVILTVAHMDHIPENIGDDNLKALCQRCHLTYDAKEHAKNAAITRNNKNKTAKLFY